MLGSMATTVMAYERWDASAYALEWHDSYNTAEYYKANLDCTNFVSQCLEAGGMKRSSSLPSYGSTKHWRPHSYTWENATGFRKYWKEQATYYDYDKITSSNVKSLNSYITKKINVGDVVQYGNSSTDIKHSQIVYNVGKLSGINTLVLAQHTSGRKNIALIDYLKATSYKYVHYYRLPESNTTRSIRNIELEKQAQDYLIQIEEEQELGIYDYMQDVEILMNTIDAVIEEVNAGNIPEEVLNESRERMEKLQELHDSYERKIEEEDYTNVENLYNCLREEFDYISETYR